MDKKDESAYNDTAECSSDKLSAAQYILKYQYLIQALIFIAITAIVYIIFTWL